MTTTPFDLTLHRMADVEGSHTFGRLELDATSEQVCLTLEEPWRDEDGNGLGDTDVSRIPPGRYPCRVAVSPKRGYPVPWVDEVPGRQAVQIHRGNHVDHTEGCVIVGTAFGKVDGKPAVLDSKTAFARLMQKLEGAPPRFYLTVVDVTYPACKEPA